MSDDAHWPLIVDYCPKHLITYYLANCSLYYVDQKMLPSCYQISIIQNGRMPPTSSCTRKSSAKERLQGNYWGYYRSGLSLNNFRPLKKMEYIKSMETQLLFSISIFNFVPRNIYSVYVHFDGKLWSYNWQDCFEFCRSLSEEHLKNLLDDVFVPTENHHLLKKVGLPCYFVIVILKTFLVQARIHTPENHNHSIF